MSQEPEAPARGKPAFNSLASSSSFFEDEGQPEDAEAEKVDDKTLSGLFLSGKLTSLINIGETEEEEEDEFTDDVAMTYFPDPPCVQPPDIEELRDETDYGRPSPIDYWKEHVHDYDCWPTVRDNRIQGMAFVKVLGGGRARTSSIMHNRMVVNVSVSDIGVRSSATLAEGAKTGQVIRPGQVVCVKSVENIDGVRFWKLKDNGHYVFETTQDGTRIMQECLNVETGMWWYRVACDECLEIRSAPSYADELRTGWVISHGSLAVVHLRCRVGSSQFLLLRDGRGWLFVWKPVQLKSGFRKAGHAIAMEECNTDFLDVNAINDVRRAIPPTDTIVEVGTWTYVVGKRPILCLGGREYGTFLSPGDLVRIDKRSTASGNMHRSEDLQERVWLRLADGRGWVPVYSDDGVEQIVEQDPGDLTYPSWFEGNVNIDNPKHAWMVGFV